MIEIAFKSGNFNQWEDMITKTLPSKIALIRETIIPQIDDVLSQMLKREETIHKNTINIEQTCSKNQIVGIKCCIEYYIEDFKVPDAPQKAIENDTRALTEALTITEASLESLTINVTEGSLTIVYQIPVEV